MVVELGLDRTALIGHASNWANWMVQLFVFGAGALICMMTQTVAGLLIAGVVALSLIDGLVRLGRVRGH